MSEQQFLVVTRSYPQCNNNLLAHIDGPLVNEMRKICVITLVPHIFLNCKVNKLINTSIKPMLLTIVTFFPMYTYEFTTAALTIELSPIKTWSPI